MPVVDTFVGLAAPLSARGFEVVRSQLGVDAPSLRSLLTVETCGFGFFADKRPKILFERHIFHQRTGGRFDAAAPDLSAAESGGYAGGPAEYDRLQRALQLDERAAVESASWGLGQIMGFNAVGLGYASALEMAGQFAGGEDAQLEGTRRFVAGNARLAAAFRNKLWDRVALHYNGPGFRKNRYDEKLRDFHDHYATLGVPSIELRAAQARLAYCGFNPGAVDGLMGAQTRRALQAFQRAMGLDISGTLDAATGAHLQLAAGV